MRSRLVVLLAVMLALAAIAFSVTRFLTSVSSASSHPAAHARLKSKLASYLGVFEPGSPPAYQPIAEFAREAGRQPNLLGYYSGWAAPFPTSYANMIYQHGMTLYVQIDPTKTSVATIADGDQDTYLKTYADSVADFGHPVVIGFGHEMNASWYPWGYGHLPAATFIKAWRHIVTLFRTEGADNVTWLWTLQADRPGTGPTASWWPGSPYVTWVGIDGYYTRPTDTFGSVFGKTIKQVRAFTKKPILLSEVAVGPAAGQVIKIGDLFEGMAQYQTLGLVWFDLAQDHGAFQQDWRIENNQSAAEAFRLGVKDDLTQEDPPQRS